MAGITLRTARQVVPMIYAYTTRNCPAQRLKIGYTERSVDKRLKQRATPADVALLKGVAGAMPSTMTAAARCSPTTIFHAYLRKLNVENDHKNEVVPSGWATRSSSIFRISHEPGAENLAGCRHRLHPAGRDRQKAELALQDLLQKPPRRGFMEP